MRECFNFYTNNFKLLLHYNKNIFLKKSQYNLNNNIIEDGTRKYILNILSKSPFNNRKKNHSVMYNPDKRRFFITPINKVLPKMKSRTLEHSQYIRMKSRRFLPFYAF